ALIETAILDEGGALFDEGYEQTEFGSTTPVNLSVNNEEFTTSALEVDATNAYADLIAEAESLEIEDVSETPLSELDFKGNLDAEMEYYFDRYGVYINGERCISLSDAAKLPQNFLSRVADARRNASLSVSSEQNGLRSGGGDSELTEVDIELEITYVRVNGSPASNVNISGAISEGLSPYTEFKTTTDYLDGDFMVVEIPELPIGYESRVSFGGSAICGADYLAYVAYPPSSLYYVPFGFDHSGGSETVYIFPVEDAQKESDETAEVFMGTPQLSGSGGVDTHSFNMLVSSATATIIDNDQWKVVATPEPAYANLDEIVITEGNQAGENEPATNKVSFTISRVENVANHAGDNHYPINVSLQFQNGTATFSDYKILHHEPNGAIAWLTPNLTNEVTVAIPAGSNSTTITIEAIDDSIIERLHETLSFYVVNAWNSSNTFAYDGASHALKIKDNDKLYLDTVQYLDNIDLVSDTQGTFGTHWGNSIHWINNYPQNTLPVAYSSSDIMKCESLTLGNIDPDVIVTVRFSWKYTDLNGDLQIAYSDWSSRSLSTGKSTAQLTSQFKTLFGEESAYYDLVSTLEWEFRVNGEDRGDDGIIANSVNPLYVTYKRPVDCPNGIYHTVIHVGCEAANMVGGGTSVQPVFDEIWGQIATLVIDKVDLIQGNVNVGERLSFYGREFEDDGEDYDNIKLCLHIKRISENNYLETQRPSVARYETILYGNDSYKTMYLLQSKDGTCDMWQSFSYDVFTAQGITIHKINVYANGNNAHPCFQMKTHFMGQGYSIRPCENTWSGHALIMYNNKVYDPSYGIEYGSLITFLSRFVMYVDSVGYENLSLDPTETSGFGLYYVPEKSYTVDTILPSDFRYVVLE
ncbi:MAG: hypothetical protein IJU03_06025, partial [Thermoguttaceae bacterium]|nr:hypothetical protein [Thermoguttaceae bacterium]